MPPVIHLMAPKGSHIVAGYKYWSYPDSNGEHLNWGLVDFNDNPYDGISDVIAPGKDAWGYATGGESE